MWRLAVIAGLAACGAPPAPVPLTNTGKVDPAPAVESAIPGEAVRVVFHPDARFSQLVDRFQFDRNCTDALAKQSAFSVTLPGEDRIAVIVKGAYDKKQIIDCTLTPLRDGQPEAGYRAIDTGEVTHFVATGQPAFQITWRRGYFVYAPGDLVPTTPTVEQVRAWRILHTGKAGIWTREPFVEQLFGAPGALLIVAKGWDMPYEWGRTITGTVAIYFASKAQATLAANRIAAGTLGPLVDPALLALIKSLDPIVDDTRVRVKLSAVTFDLAMLLDQVR